MQLLRQNLAFFSGFLHPIFSDFRTLSPSSPSLGRIRWYCFRVFVFSFQVGALLCAFTYWRKGHQLRITSFLGTLWLPTLCLCKATSTNRLAPRGSTAPIGEWTREVRRTCRCMMVYGLSYSQRYYKLIRRINKLYF
jgi:hypothetical protein